MDDKRNFFVCNYLVEMVILCDGRVTTCCIDPMGINSYASIYSDSFSEVVDKYLATRMKLARNFKSLPKCSECHSIFEKTGNLNMIFQATDAQVGDFIKQGRDYRRYRFVIEPTSKCNLKCKGCVQAAINLSDYRDRPFIDFDQLERWILPEIDKVGEIRFYNYGETFLHPKSLDFLSLLKVNNSNIQIEIATNGLLLDTPEKQKKLIQSGVDSVVFSIHGSNQDNIEKYMTHNFKFGKVMKILTQLVQIRREMNATAPRLIWKYLLFKWNDSESCILEAKKQAQKIGVDEIWFELASHPAPSGRFAPNNDAWKKFTMDMRMINSITGIWDARQSIGVHKATIIRKMINKIMCLKK